MSFLAGISEKGNEVFSILQKGASDDLSGAEVLRSLRIAGHKYTTSVFYKDYGIVSAAEKNFAGMRHITKGGLVSEKWYAEAGTPLKSNYQTVIGMRGIHEDTGEEVTRYVTVSHDSLKTREELDDMALSVAGDTSPKVAFTSAFPVLARSSAVLW